MPLTLDATFGGLNSNSYQTVASAQAILDGVPNADAWTAGQPSDQALWLVRGTTMLEALRWLGVKVGGAETQALAWPRNFVPDPDYGSVDAQWIGWVGGTVYLPNAVMPRRLLRAHAALGLEIARAGTGDVWGVDDTINIVSDRVGPLSTTYVAPGERRLGLRAFPQVWREVFPLLEVSMPATVRRA